MRGLGGKIDFVMTPGDIKRLRQFSRTGTEPPNVIDATSLPHQRDSTPRLDCADENEAVTRTAFDEDVEHPMHAVIEIDVGGAGFIALDKFARARAFEGVRGFVLLGEICFRLDDDSAAFFPDKFRADEIFSTGQWVGPEKAVGKHEQRRLTSSRPARLFAHSELREQKRKDVSLLFDPLAQGGPNSVPRAGAGAQ